MSEVERLRDQVEELQYRIELLTGQAASDALVDFGVHLPKQHDRVVRRLLRSKGEVVAYEQLEAAMYHDRLPQDWPESPRFSLAVAIAGIRKALPSERWEVSTVYRVGYRLIEKEIGSG